MYLPPNDTWILEAIRYSPLATLVTCGDTGVFATHLPVILDPEQSEPTTLQGLRLLGHMNRVNPHWPAVRDGDQALLIFQGPHGYVSPTVYRTSPAAPTWNFVAVHVRGRIAPLARGRETWQVVRSTVDTLERDVGTGWDPTDSVEYLKQLLPGVGAFRLVATTVDGMFKLSQEKSSVVRKLVADSFTDRERNTALALAELMHRID